MSVAAETQSSLNRAVRSVVGGLGAVIAAPLWAIALLSLFAAAVDGDWVAVGVGVGATLLASIVTVSSRRAAPKRNRRMTVSLPSASENDFSGLPDPPGTATFIRAPEQLAWFGSGIITFLLFPLGLLILLVDACLGGDLSVALAGLAIASIGPLFLGLTYVFRR